MRRSIFLLPLLLGTLALVPPSAPADWLTDETAATYEALLKENKVPGDGPGLLEFFRKRTLTEADRKNLAALVRQLGSDSLRQRKQATDTLIAVGPPALPFLQPALKDPDIEIKTRAETCIKAIARGPGPALPAAAARVLAQRRPPGAVAALLNYLPFIDDDWLMDEVLASLGALAVSPGKVDPLVVAALKDSLPVRRAGAAYVLGLAGGPNERELVRPLLADPDAGVRVRAAVGLIGKEDFQPAQEALAADEDILKKNRVGTDGAALLAFLRKRSLTDADRDSLRRLVRQLGDARYVKRRQAANELVARGTQALPFLEPALADPDLEIRRRGEQCIAAINRGPGTALPAAAVRLLAKLAPPEAVDVLLGYAPSAEDALVEETVLASLSALGVRGPKLDPALARALHDPAPERRAAAAYVLGRVGTRADCQAVRRLLTDADPKVRLRAAQGLLSAKERAGLPVLVELLKDESRGGPAQLAEDTLRHVAGAGAPLASVGEERAEERAKARAAWDAWYRTQGGRVDLARVHRREAQLGLTVICEFDSVNPGTSQVWEFGRDVNKPLWKIQNLQGAMDAHVLAGGSKVLVAEYYGMRVTERDIKTGAVKWEHKVTTYPIACDRLPNGNTFIATYSNLLEVTPDHKEVYNHARGADGQIYSAQKLKNGHIVYMTSAGWVGEVDGKTGRVIHRFNVGNPGAWCGVEKLPNGRFLVSLMVTGKVMEVDPSGRSYWTTTVVGAHQTLRLPNGHTLIVCMNNKRLVEVDRAGKELWIKPTEGRPWRVHRR